MAFFVETNERFRLKQEILKVDNNFSNCWMKHTVIVRCDMALNCYLRIVCEKMLDLELNMYKIIWTNEFLVSCKFSGS